MPIGDATQLQRFAEVILACESALLNERGGKTVPAFHACDKLRIPLGEVFGVGGYRPLLLRAIALAGAKCAWLRQMRVRADGALEGFAELKPMPDPSTLAEGEIVLIQELLGLLVTFIGPAMTLSLVRDLWPALAELKLENGTL